MPNQPSTDPTELKIFPRNLTARADYIVRGNPTNTRPESGVDNCFPGLEFDQRNLDKAFFPGFIFEFHRDDGAIIHRLAPSAPAVDSGLTEGDLNPPLYLWALNGRTMKDQTGGNIPIFFFDRLEGLEVWRRVHDLRHERVAILIGPTSGLFVQIPSDSIKKLNDLYKSTNVNSYVERDSQGKLQWAVFAGERAPYLDPETGVIDPSVYGPGELTRSLCVPWQYDFRDCGCFYWASNKPDIVISGDGLHEQLNFQRLDRTSDPPPSDLPTYLERRPLEISYTALLSGAWNTTLPSVLNDRESECFVPPPAPDVPRLMTRGEVIEELKYLSTVEHALLVEYLYAHYSLNAPPALPAIGVSDQTRRIFAAADEVFRIAVDEMRHLRWVNEALNLLGEGPVTDRAEIIGRVPEVRRPFQLNPLTPEQLQWFVDIERPSQAINEGIDGMYVRLHVSIDRQPALFPERKRLIHLIKLIIDEGGDHFRRFQTIQKHLSDLPPEQYLRPLGEAPADSLLLKSLLSLSDQNYAVVLGYLLTSFLLGDRAGGINIEDSRRAMFNVHDTNHHLASRGVGAKFNLPTPRAPLPRAAAITPEIAGSLVDNLQSSVEEALASVEDVGGEDERQLVTRQRRNYEGLFRQMRRRALKYK